MVLLIYLRAKWQLLARRIWVQMIDMVRVPEEYKDKVEELRTQIVEAACEFDDMLAEKFLNEEEISIDEIKAAFRKGVIAQKVAPAFCGTAFKNKGVQLIA